VIGFQAQLQRDASKKKGESHRGDALEHLTMPLKVQRAAARHTWEPWPYMEAQVKSDKPWKNDGHEADLERAKRPFGYERSL
jgi:hypothetical protein